MAHAGTMVGGSAQTKQTGSPWAAIALAAAVVVAAIAGVWLASSAGLVGGTAKPVADRSYDQIEAPPTIAPPPAFVCRPALAFTSVGNITGSFNATSNVLTLTGNDTRTLNEKFLLFDRAHAAPFAGPAVTPLPSATSGTFHPGKAADDQVVTQPKRTIGPHR